MPSFAEMYSNPDLKFMEADDYSPLDVFAAQNMRPHNYRVYRRKYPLTRDAEAILAVRLSHCQTQRESVDRKHPS